MINIVASSPGSHLHAGYCTWWPLNPHQISRVQRSPHAMIPSMWRRSLGTRLAWLYIHVRISHSAKFSKRTMFTVFINSLEWWKSGPWNIAVYYTIYLPPSTKLCPWNILIHENSLPQKLTTIIILWYRYFTSDQCMETHWNDLFSELVYVQCIYQFHIAETVRMTMPSTKPWTWVSCLILEMTSSILLK